MSAGATSRMWAAVALGFGLAIWLAPRLQADIPSQRCAAPCIDADTRAGNPRQISRWAQPSNTDDYVGYYVGGGAAKKGQARFVSEGTWGWDYCGTWLHRRVGLLWRHSDTGPSGG